MKLVESPVKIEMKGVASAGTGPDLTGYPSLTYAPLQHGEGIRFASNGKLIGDVLGDISAVMDELDTIAKTEGVSLGELLDAVRYSRATGAV